MPRVLLFLENTISYIFPFSLLLIFGIQLTLQGGFFQISLLPKSIKLLIKAIKQRSRKQEGISSFQAACTALSGTVGTGNITGVAGAIGIGGAGAVFWMWVSAFLGMAIKYTEISLAVKYREKREGEYKGGPMYYIKNGLSSRFRRIGYLFAAVCLPSVICTGNITQTNSAVNAVSENASVRLYFGIGFLIFTALTVLGGAKRICSITERILPIMSVCYILMAVGVIFRNYNLLGNAFKDIFVGAFSPKSVTGGIVGSVIKCFMTGASRGVFSNESGLGTSAMAHAVAFDADWKTQGLFGIIEVFIDTLIICTLTALTILCSGVNIEYGSFLGAGLVSKAMSMTYGSIAQPMIAIMMLVFAFSSVVGWAFYGQVCSEFLFGSLGIKIFSYLYPFACILGAVCNVELAWRLSEFFNGIMLCINLPVIYYLSDNGGLINDRRKNRGNKQIFRIRSGSINN